MGRTTEGVTSPVELIKRFARYYTQTLKTGDTHQLYFFSKNIIECDSLLIFGGAVYRQRGGWAWICGNKKHLASVYKVLEPESAFTPDITEFMKWAKEHLA